MKKYTAPALASGIKVLNILNEKGAMKLVTMTELTNIPGSSLLRILDTLQDFDLVIKRDQYYTALGEIVVKNENYSRQKHIEKFVKKVATYFSTTCEWYEYRDEKLKIIDRFEIENQNIKVMAKLGFERKMFGEFDAVARCAVINKLVADFDPSNWWKYEQSDERKALSIGEVVAEVENSALFTVDFIYNINGVRRCVAPVFCSSGDCIALVALTAAYRVNKNQEWEQMSRELLDFVNKESFV